MRQRERERESEREREREREERERGERERRERKRERERGERERREREEREREIELREHKNELVFQNTNLKFAGCSSSISRTSKAMKSAIASVTDRASDPVLSWPPTRDFWQPRGLLSKVLHEKPHCEACFVNEVLHKEHDPKWLASAA